MSRRNARSRYRYEIENVNRIHRELVGLTLRQARKLVYNFTRIKVHRQLWLIQGGRCAYCGIRVMVYRKRYKKGQKIPEHSMTIDHLDPASNGGTRNPDNIVGACFKCNQDRGTMPLEEWLEKNPRSPLVMFKHKASGGETLPDEVPDKEE